MYNILEIFKDFYFLPYLFVSAGVLGVIYLLKRVVVGR